MRFTLIVTALVGMAAFANADQPSPGTYLIVNRVASPTGQSLAATFEGGQTKLTVTPLTGSSAQLVSFFSISFRGIPEPLHLQWIITLGEQFIIPVNDQTKAATATGNLVVALPKNGFVWTINNATSQYYT